MSGAEAPRGSEGSAPQDRHAPDRPDTPSRRFEEEAPRTVVWRLVLGTVGLGGILYGAGRILQSPASVRPLDLGEWLLGALILHDGVLAPVVTVFGFLMARLVPGRARAYLQGGLITGGLVTTFVLLEIYRHGKAQPGNTLLIQDYVGHLLLVLAVVAVLTALLYGLRVWRDRRAAHGPAVSGRPAAASPRGTARPGR